MKASSADPDYGTGLTGHGTMVMPRLGFAKTNDRAFRKEEGPRASDKVSDNGSRQRQTQGDVPRYRYPCELQ
jgi:hypothetical protein